MSGDITSDRPSQDIPIGMSERTTSIEKDPRFFYLRSAIQRTPSDLMTHSLALLFFSSVASSEYKHGHEITLQSFRRAVTCSLSLLDTLHSVSVSSISRVHCRELEIT